MADLLVDQERGMGDNTVTVLLVEDNPGDASLIRRMLSAISVNFQIKHATKLSEGLAQLQQAEVDLVLLDLCLPDSSGLDTLTRIRAQAPYVPIIVITGMSERETAVKALDQGAQDFIAKERVDEHLLSQAVLRRIGRTQSL